MPKENLELPVPQYVWSGFWGARDLHVCAWRLHAPSAVLSRAAFMFCCSSTAVAEEERARQIPLQC